MNGDLDWFGKKKRKDEPAFVQSTPAPLFSFKAPSNLPPKQSQSSPSFFGIKAPQQRQMKSMEPSWKVPKSTKNILIPAPSKNNSPFNVTSSNKSQQHEPLLKIFPLSKMFRSINSKYKPGKTNSPLTPNSLFKKEKITDSHLSKWGDADMDGTPNYLDCDPKDWRKDAIDRYPATKKRKRIIQPKTKRDAYELQLAKERTARLKIQAVKLGRKERLEREAASTKRENKARKERRADERRRLTRISRARNIRKRKEATTKLDKIFADVSERTHKIRRGIKIATESEKARKIAVEYGTPAIKRKMTALEKKLITGRIPLAQAEEQYKQYMAFHKVAGKAEAREAKKQKRLATAKEKAMAKYRTYEKATYGGKKEIVGALAEAGVAELGIEKRAIRKYQEKLGKRLEQELTPQERSSLTRYRMLEDKGLPIPKALKDSYKLARAKEALIVTEVEKPSVLEKWQPGKKTLEKYNLPSITIEALPMSKAERLKHLKSLEIAQKLAEGKAPSQKQLKAYEKAKEEAKFTTRGKKFAAKVAPTSLAMSVLTPGGKYGVVGEGLHYTKEARKTSEHVGKLTKTAVNVLFGPSLTRSFQGRSEPRQRGRPSGPSGSYKIGGRPVYEQEYQDYMAKQNALRRMTPSEQQTQTLNPEYIDYLRRKEKEKEIRQMAGKGPDQLQGEGQPPLEMGDQIQEAQAQQIEQMQSIQAAAGGEGEVMTQGEQPPTGQQLTAQQQQPQQYDVKELQHQAQEADQILKAPQFAKGELKNTGGSLLTTSGPTILDAPNTFKGEMRTLNKGQEVPSVRLSERPQTNPYGEDYIEIDISSGKPKLRKRSREAWMTGEAL